jgi:hypothetical protein
MSQELIPEDNPAQPDADLVDDESAEEAPAAPARDPEADDRAQRIADLERENRLYQQLLLEQRAPVPEAEPEEELDPAEAARRLRRLEQEAASTRAFVQLQSEDTRLSSDPGKYPGYQKEACLEIIYDRYRRTGSQLSLEDAYAIWSMKNRPNVRQEIEAENRKNVARETGMNRQTLPIASVPASAMRPDQRVYGGGKKIADMSLAEYEKATRQDGFVPGPNGTLVRRG